MQNTMKTKTGLLTPYALNCGYVQQIDKDNLRLTLWKEHGALHVRAHDFENGRIFWDFFDTLGAARKRFSVAKRELKLH
jgi:hypothetical protein